MAVNPSILEESGLFPILASGAITAKYAVIATTASGGKQRGKKGDAVGQNVAIASVPRFLGVATEDADDATMATIQRRGRARVIGGGVVTAPALVTLDASGKFVTYTHDATKFGMVVGIAATDCAGDDSYFDVILDPMIVGPANATGVNMTLSGNLTVDGVIQATDGTVNVTGGLTATTTVTAEQITSTDDATITGMLSVGEHIDITEEVEPAAPAANTGRLFCVDSGAGKTILKVRFASGASQTIATEP